MTLVQHSMISWLTTKDKVRIGQVYDSDGEFFVVTGVQYRRDFVCVIGDIINDIEHRVNVSMGRSAMLALYPVMMMDDVRESHIWGTFYKNKLSQAADPF